MKRKYFYVSCDGGAGVNEAYRFYFRLYSKEGTNDPILVDQGLSNKTAGWEAQYGATLELANPYPHLD